MLVPDTERELRVAGMNEGEAPVARLADDFFFIAHDDRSGRRRLAQPVVSIGLAASLLGELLLSGHLMVHENALYPVHGYPPEGGLVAEIMHLVTGRPNDRDLGTWLTFLAAEAVTDVGERLVAEGQVTRVKRRRLAGSRVEFQPVNISAAAWPAIRIAGILSRGEAMSVSDTTLTGLVDATGLTGHVLWDAEVHRPGYAHIEPLLAMLPAPLSTLLARTRVAVGDVVLTKRG